MHDDEWSRILGVPTQELQHRFDIELPESVKQLLSYARTFLEFCSYQALYLITTTRPDYLADKDFRRFTYDIMLAWDSPSPSPTPSLEIDSPHQVSLSIIIAYLTSNHFTLYTTMLYSFLMLSQLCFSSLLFNCRKLPLPHSVTMKKRTTMAGHFFIPIPQIWLFRFLFFNVFLSCFFIYK